MAPDPDRFGELDTTPGPPLPAALIFHSTSVAGPWLVTYLIYFVLPLCTAALLTYLAVLRSRLPPSSSHPTAPPQPATPQPKGPRLAVPTTPRTPGISVAPTSLKPRRPSAHRLTIDTSALAQQPRTTTASSSTSQPLLTASLVEALNSLNSPATPIPPSPFASPMQPTPRKLYPMTPAIQPARQPSPARKPCIPARGDEESEILLRFTHHHDLAYKTVERAVALEQQKAYASALKYYTAGLHELNAALRSPLPADDRKQPDVREKMLKMERAKATIEARMKRLQQSQEPSPAPCFHPPIQLRQHRQSLPSPFAAGPAAHRQLSSQPHSPKPPPSSPPVRPDRRPDSPVPDRRPASVNATNAASGSSSSSDSGTDVSSRPRAKSSARPATSHAAPPPPFASPRRPVSAVPSSRPQTAHSDGRRASPPPPPPLRAQTQPTAPAPPVPVAPPHLANPRPGPEEILAGLRAHGVDETMAQFVLDNTFQPSPAVAWDTVAGLDPIKRNLQESVVFPLLRPDLFTGLRAPPRGILLFGPSGTGKTLLVRAAAREARCAFFSVSPCTLLSLHPDRRTTFLRTLCVVAQTMAPSLVFWDDLDHNLFTGSGSSEQMQQYELRGELIASFERLMAAHSSESTTASPLDHSQAALPPSRLPSTTNSSASLTSLPASTLTTNSPDIRVTSSLVVVMAATNQPERLDDRLRARFARRIYVPLPNLVTRYTLITHLLSGASSYTTTTPHHAYAGDSPPNSLKSATDHRHHQLSQRQIDHLVELADGYACSDILAVGKDAALVPIREITDPQQLLTLAADAIRSVKYEDWLTALGRRKPSVDPARHAFFKQWARLYASEVDN